MSTVDAEPHPEYHGPPGRALREEPPAPINWNVLDAETAEAEWRDLDMFVTWLKTAFGLPPAIVPPYWHRHDELIWELSALHSHFLACHDETASPSAPIAWMSDFASARHRLRDWVALCGTRLDRDRPTRPNALARGTRRGQCGGGRDPRPRRRLRGVRPRGRRPSAADRGDHRTATLRVAETATPNSFIRHESTTQTTSTP